MDPRLIARIRKGQAALRDEAVAERLVASGVLNREDVDCVSSSKALSALLRDDGRVPPDRLAESSDEVERADADDIRGLPTGAFQQLELSAGTRVENCVLMRPLGKGGMGEVWLAARDDRNELVAIKFLMVEDDGARARFLREATITTELDHPLIPRVYELGDVDGRAYLIQAFVDGESLAERTLPRRRAAAVLRDVASALHYAHERGVIHRDVKPSNVVLGLDERAHLIDFGLARAMEVATRLTATGTILGTPNYMAPEQARGQSADERTDIYSAAATAYTLLSGAPPIQGSNVIAVVRRVATTPAEPLPEVDDLARVVNRAMAHEPAKRYESAAALLEDVEAYLAGRPLAGRAKESWFRRLFRRNQAT